MRLSHINGILAIVFGGIAILFPSITIKVLSIYFALTFIVGGLALIVSSRHIYLHGSGISTLRLEGLLGVLVGVAVLISPLAAAKLFIIIIGIWGLALSAILLISYFRHKLPEEKNIVHLIGGVVTLIFGLLIIFNPFDSMRFVTIVIGIFVLTYGIISIIHTTKVHSQKHNV